MRKISFIKTASLLLICGFFANCTSYMEFRKMDLNADNTSGKILNLEFAGDPSGDYTGQAEKLVKSGFLNTADEEYGFYDIRFECITKDYKPVWVAVARPVPILWLFYLLGAPTAGEEFTIRGHFLIFDSRGDIVKHYRSDGTFDKWIGLFYGNATGKGEDYFSQLFSELFRKADAESGEINQALKAAGPISGADMKQVQANIDAYFRN
jgi:hypothetical protein